MDHPDFETDAESAAYLTRLIASGQTLKAIHFVCQREQIPLAEGKRQVERLRAELEQLPDGHPDKPPRRRLPPILIPFLVFDALVLLAVALWLLSRD